MRSNIEKSTKYRYDKHTFDNIDNEYKAYWLGFLYADGYILSKRKHSSKKMGLALSIKDEKHMRKFKNFMNTDAPIKIYENYTFNKKYCRLLFTGDYICNTLIDKGMLEHKSLILLFPSIHQVPEEFIRHFLRGYFDGDGSIVKRSKKESSKAYTISLLGTKEFLSHIIKKYNLKCKLEKKKGVETNNYYIRIHSINEVEKVLDYIYKDSNIYLDRKYNIYKKIKE